MWGTRSNADGQSRSRPVISLLTDFGSLGGYVGSVKGVIHSRTDADIVDISHEISPQSVMEGAFVLKSVVSYFPEGSVHMAVIDPGVGGPRRPIAIHAGGHYFVGPDNGVLIPAARTCGSVEVREIDAKKMGASGISSTFHGRDIFAPAVAYLSAGGKFEKIGRIFKSYREMDFGEVRSIPSGLSGICIYADAFGNIITNIGAAEFRKLFSVGERVNVICGDFKQALKFTRIYADVDEGEPLVLVGSHGNVEVAVSGSSARNLFDCRQGTEISFRHIRF